MSSITIITGTPGAGKTLYAVTKLIRPLIGATVDKEEDDGSITQHPVKIYTNINGLTLDHELIDGSAEGGLRNWHEWATPGTVIVVDEVQKIWKPRANGSAVPEDIGALETVRHMGVQFILLTQGIMLSERNLLALCGRHLHIRRIGMLPLAIVYEWDHASRSLMYSKAFTKKPWRYDKAGYKLYKSAELHMKTKRAVPTLAYFVLAGVAALAYLAPTLKARMDERFGGGQKIAAAPAGAPNGAGATLPPPGQQTAGSDPENAPEHGPINDAKDWIPRDPLRPESAPAYDGLRQVAVMPRLVGCMSMGSKAQCYTQQGTRVEVHPDMARSLMERPLFDPYQPLQQQAGAVGPAAQAQPVDQAPGVVLISGPGHRDPQGMRAALQ